MSLNIIDGKKTTGSEVIWGTAKNDWIYPLGGSDIVDGREGYDTVVVEWQSTNFKISTAPGITYLDTISGASSADKVTLLNVEAVQFPDKTLLLYQDQRFSNNPGSEAFLGNWGLDSVTYQGLRQNYTVTLDASGADVRDRVGNMGTDRLIDIERIHFDGVSLALDTSGVGGQAYRIYKAAFNRTPDVGGLGFWISGMDGGISLNAVAQGFVNSAEFKTVYGASPTNAQIVTRFYDNVLGRAAESGGYSYWLGVLNSGQASVAGVLAAFSESPENQAGVIGVIGTGILYTPYG